MTEASDKVWTDRVERGLLLAATLSMFAFACTVPLDLPDGLRLFVNSVGFSLTFLLSAAHLVYRAVMGSPDERSWLWPAAAFVLFALANIWYAGAETWQLPRPGFNIADLLWLCAFPPLLIGVARLVRPLTRGEGAVAVLDATLVAMAVFTVAMALLSAALSGPLAQASGDELVFNTLDLLGDDILLAIALGAAHATHWRPPAWVWTLLGGALVFAFADAFYVVQIVSGRYLEGGLLDIGWPLSALLLSCAAHQRGRAFRRAVSLRHWDTDFQTLMSAVMIPLAAVGLVLGSHGPLAAGAKVAGLITVSLAGLRLFIAVRQATAMALELRESRIDALTGLPNLRMLRGRPQQLLMDRVLISIDLDGLRDINRDFGEQIGDQVLIAVADRIAIGTPDRDVLARVGGDEFAVLLHGVSPEAAVHIAEAVVMQTEAEITVAGRSLRVGACAGISAVCGANDDIDQLVTQAQAALREAKRNGSGLVRSFAGTSGAQTQERLRLRAEIKHSLRGNAPDFVPYFQPIVGLADNQLLAVEALVRWHRDGEVWSPSEFLDDVVRSASMATLTAHMLEASLRHLREAGVDAPVTVNVPPDLVDGSLLHMVRGALAESGSTPAQLIVEITEDAIMRNPAQAASVLGELRTMGVRVLLDDFGTGWSGLSALRDFVVDGLKLDGTFSRSMHVDSTTQTIVQAVSDLASQLGMLVIYEGVEDPEQLERLIAAREGYVQGFALARPMPASALAQWLAAGAPAATARVDARRSPQL